MQQFHVPDDQFHSPHPIPSQIIRCLSKLHKETKLIDTNHTPFRNHQKFVGLTVFRRHMIEILKSQPNVNKARSSKRYSFITTSPRRRSHMHLWHHHSQYDANLHPSLQLEVQSQKVLMSFNTSMKRFPAPSKHRRLLSMLCNKDFVMDCVSPAI